MKLLAATLTILLGAACIGPVWAGEAVVLVTFEGMSLDEMLRWDIPELRALTDVGALGLMNNKTAANQNSEDNAVTIGAGTRGMGYERPSVDTFSAYAANASDPLGEEMAETIWRRNTGLTGYAAVVQTRIASIITANTGLGYEVIPGLTGDLLEKAGVKVSVYGNSDRGAAPFRAGVMVAMDRQGTVGFGDVGKRTLRPDPLRPFGVRTDYSFILDRIRESDGNRFIVIEAGDGGRAEAAGPDLMPGRLDQFKRQAALECARFLVKLNERLRAKNERYLLIFLVPAQGAAAYAEGDRLTPVLILGSGIEPGITASSTTRRPGIVTNLDIAPTILRFFGVKPHPSMLGMPISSQQTTHAPTILARMNEEVVKTFNARRPIVIGVVAFIIITTLLAILSIILNMARSPVLGAVCHPSRLRFMVAASMLPPAVLLIAPALGIRSLIPTAVFLVVVTVVAAFVLNRLARDMRDLFAVIGLGVAVAFTADLLTGSNLTKNSIFGYDPIAGLRFYGIGNESSGVLMGALILGVYSLCSRTKRIGWAQVVSMALLFAGITYAVGSPSLGADFGGVPAMLAGFGYALYRVMSGRARLSTFLWVALAAAVLFVGIIAANTLLDPEHQTHIGRAIAQSRESGGRVFLDLAVRKWEMNLRMFRYSAWTYVLVCLTAALIVLFIRPVGALRRTLSKHPVMNAAFAGTLVGSVVGFLINDSGIVMAATALLYMALPLMWMVRVEMEAADEGMANG